MLVPRLWLELLEYVERKFIVIIQVQVAAIFRRLPDGVTINSLFFVNVIFDVILIAPPGLAHQRYTLRHLSAHSVAPAESGRRPDEKAFLLNLNRHSEVRLDVRLEAELLAAQLKQALHLDERAKLRARVRHKYAAVFEAETRLSS